MTSPLRQAALADLDAIMRLENDGFVPGIVEDGSVFRRRVEAFPDGFLLAGSPPWGYLCAEIWNGDQGPEAFHLGHDIAAVLDRNGDTLYIASMTVHSARRGEGLGKRLFREGVALLRNRFPGVRRALLIVNEHWTGARTIYSGEGFVETGRLPGFFRPWEGPVGDALVMQKPLEELERVR